MVRRGEKVNLGGLWLEGHGLWERSETSGLSSRVRRAASSLQMQPEGSVEASHGLAKTPTLTMLVYLYGSAPAGSGCSSTRVPYETMICDASPVSSEERGAGVTAGARV